MTETRSFARQLIINQWERRNINRDIHTSQAHVERDLWHDLISKTVTFFLIFKIAVMNNSEAEIIARHHGAIVKSKQHQ
jgi:hypothetical protein